MIEFSHKDHGTLGDWVVHNIEVGPEGNEGTIWGCQVDRKDAPHTGLIVHYDGSGGQIQITDMDPDCGNERQFLNDCEDCLRKLFPGKHPPEHRIAAAEGILAFVIDDPSNLDPQVMGKHLSYLVSDRPPNRPVSTPMLDRLQRIRPFSEKIQEFLEFMHDQGYELKRTVPAGWCSPDGSERISDEELQERGIERLSGNDLIRFSLDSDLRVACTPEHWKLALEAWRETSVWTARQELEKGLWRWDRGIEANDVGVEGRTLDKHLYAFFEIDPDGIEEERQALLDSLKDGRDV